MSCSIRVPSFSFRGGIGGPGGVFSGSGAELKMVCSVLGGSTALEECGARIAHQFAEHIAYASSAPPAHVVSRH